MTINLSKIKFIILIAPLFLTACVNLKEVSTYSTNSLNAISKYEELNYSFTQNNREVYRLTMTGKTIYSDSLNVSEYEILNLEGKKADSMVNILYNAIERYFFTLGKISDNELTNYNFSSLKEKIQEDDNLGIGKKQVESYEKMTKTLLKSTTDIYRKKKIKEFITESDSSIQVLLETFKGIIQISLKTSLVARKESMDFATVELFSSDSFSEAEKRQWFIYYYNSIDEMNLIKSKIDCLSESIDKIKEGHRFLYDNRNKITAKEIKKMVQEYSTDIHNITNEFKNIKY